MIKFTSCLPMVGGSLQLLRKGRQFLLLYWHPSCSSRYKLRWQVMNEERTGKWKISLVICESDIPIMYHEVEPWHQIWPRRRRGLLSKQSWIAVVLNLVWRSNVKLIRCHCIPLNVPEPFAFKLGSKIIKSYDSSINILFQVNNTGSMNHLLFGRNKIARNN